MNRCSNQSKMEDSWIKKKKINGISVDLVYIYNHGGSGMGRIVYSKQEID